MQSLSNKALLLPDLYTKFEDLVDKTALIKSLKEPEDKIGEPSPIRGNKFSHLSLEDWSLPLWASEQLSFFWALLLLVNYGKITVLRNTVV
jgi:chromatin segregation and condensation protein Rec8/ScpA/Scc1 (kleisin family)